MPYVVLDGTNVYDRLREPKFHWLVFSNKQAEWEPVKMNLSRNYHELVDFYGFELTDEVREKFSTDRPFSIFLRPDNYIGFISAEISPIEVVRYLDQLGSP
jgi:hypothetical protein